MLALRNFDSIDYRARNQILSRHRPMGFVYLILQSFVRMCQPVRRLDAGRE
jgi:hypothetical protein